MKLKETVRLVKASTGKMIDNALSREVFETVKEAELQGIEEAVYGAYTPKMYQRRGDWGGFVDPDNIEIMGDTAKNGRLVVVNTTPPDGSDPSYTTDKVLSELIARGHRRYTHEHPDQHGYDFPGGAYSKPRDFVDAAKEHYTKNDLLDALHAGLLRQWDGFKFEK